MMAFLPTSRKETRCSPGFRMVVARIGLMSSSPAIGLPGLLPVGAPEDAGPGEGGSFTASTAEAAGSGPEVGSGAAAAHPSTAIAAKTSTTASHTRNEDGTNIRFKLPIYGPVSYTPKVKANRPKLLELELIRSTWPWV